MKFNINLLYARFSTVCLAIVPPIFAYKEALYSIRRYPSIYPNGVSDVETSYLFMTYMMGFVVTAVILTIMAALYHLWRKPNVRS